MIELALVIDLGAPASQNRAELELCYQRVHLPLLRALLDEASAAVALVCNSWLLQRWSEWGWEEGLAALRHLYDFGKVELCGTASHQAILPLVPENVAFRQVRRNSAWLQQLLHPDWRPAGFAPPQLAFGHELSRVLLALGFQWCLADDSAYCALHGGAPGGHLVRSQGLVMLLCSRLWSQRLQQLADMSAAEMSAVQLARWHHQGLHQWLPEGGYQVLRVAAESLRVSDLKDFLRCHQDLGQRWCHPSHLLERYPILEGDVPPGTAETAVEDFWSGQFFSPWLPEGEAWTLSQEALWSLEQLQDRLDQVLTSTTFLGSGSQDVQGLRTLLEAFRKATH